MDNFNSQNIEQDSYKTGSTKPPKSRGGLVAGLLIAVILLAGVASILGVMNIQLFRMLEAEKNSFASFAPTQTQHIPTGPVQDISGKPELGLTVNSISELDQRYFHLPAGLLITGVEAHSCAAKAGLVVGDIILSFNGVEVQTVEALEQVLLSCRVGDRVKVEFYRYRTEKQLETTVGLDAAYE